MTAVLASLTVVVQLVLLIAVLTVMLAGTVLCWDIMAGPSARDAAARRHARRADR